MTGWKARVRSFVGTWPMWVAALAVISAFVGIGRGAWHPDAQADSNLAKGSAVMTPGGDPAADVSDEMASRQMFAPVKEEPQMNPYCPVSDNITSKLTTTVSAAESFVFASSLHVTLTGVLPPHPSLNLKEGLEQPEGARLFASCFIATDAGITSINWADGKLEADLNLKWQTGYNRNDTTGYTHRFGYTNQLVEPRLIKGHYALIVDICQAHPEWADGVRIICQLGANSTVVVRVKRPVEAASSMPFPTDQEGKDDYVDNTWQFQGPMPPLTVTLNAPTNVLAESWLHWNRSRGFDMPFIHSPASVDLYDIADASAIWLALIVAAVLLRGKQVTAGWLSPSRSLLLIVLAGIVLGFEIQRLGHLPQPWCNGLIVVLTWGILGVAVGTKRLLPVIAVLSLATLAPGCWVAISPPGATAIRLLAIEFCVAMVLLVVTAASALWSRVLTLFALADLNDRTSIWYERYRRIIYCLVVAAFMFSVGFPFGEALVDRRPLITDLAARLIWSAGVSFRSVLGWVSLLLAISYLAGYLINRSPGTIVVPQKRPWACVRWVRVCDRTVAAVFAMILCLSAPWTARFAVGLAIPVWVLQFGTLWLGFGLLAGTSGLHVLTRQRSRRVTHLLQAATATTPNDASPMNPGSDPLQAAGASSVQTIEMPDPEAGSRLLVLGSQPGRLANAKAAAQLASIIAIIPVGYLIWTTVPKAGLNTNTGMLIVALLAFLEFTRWVVSGFVFGYLYSRLPGRFGPVKALSFAAIWIVSCVGPLVVALSSGSNLTQEVEYRSVQFALFAIVLAVLFDLKTVRTAGGTWRDLRNVYNLQNYAEVAAAVTPAALLALSLAHQAMTGSAPTAVANTLLSGIPGVLKGPG